MAGSGAAVDSSCDWRSDREVAAVRRRGIYLETYVCQRCNVSFEREPKPRSYKFCSHKCANASKCKVDLSIVKRLALLGLRLEEIGRLAAIHPRTARKVIDDLGIYREWSQVRYQKCRG